MSLYSSPDFGTPKKEHLVSDVLYSDIAHSLGEETDTGVTNVRIDMDENEALCFGEDVGKEVGQDKDQTGVEIGGGGGMGMGVVCQCGGL